VEEALLPRDANFETPTGNAVIRGFLRSVAKIKNFDDPACLHEIKGLASS